MGLDSVAANLLRLRTERDLTQPALAELAGISKQGYQLIESGAVEPRSSTLEALARALKVPLADLLRPVAHLAHVRFRSEEPLRTRAAIEARVASWLRDYTEIEELLGRQRPWRLGDVRGATPAAVAAEARRRLGLAPSDSIRDPCGLFEDNGIKVGAVPFATSRFFGLSIGPGGGGPAVVVNTWERITVERWRFTLAHELGHLLLHHADYDVAERGEDVAHEYEADVFASAFMMPPEVFEKEWQGARGLDIVERVMKVKRIFRVSWRTVLHRVAADGDAGAWGLFLDAYRKQHGVQLARTDEPSALKPEEFRPSPSEREPKGLDDADFREDRLARLVREGVESEAITLSRAAEILRIPLREARALAASWAR